MRPAITASAAARDPAVAAALGDARRAVQTGVAELESLDTENLEGKTVDFTGAFTMRTFNQPTIDASEVRIVPIAVAAR